MSDRRSRPLAALGGRQSEAPQRLGEVLSEVLARYGYDVRPQIVERSSARSAVTATAPRQLELFNETGLPALA